jgi:hypothetical protein
MSAAACPRPAAARRARAPGPALLLTLAVGTAAAPDALAGASARAGDAPPPGAYCPFPKEGETPTCLAPAEARYGEFFSAVRAGEVDEARLAGVERDVAGDPGSQDAYLALSSLAYGYFRLSERAALTPEADPEIGARLERWNALFGQAWDASPEDPAFRRAVREATRDLQQRAPPVTLRCRDARGDASPCSSTDAVARGIDATADEAGLRGGLERVLLRLFGREDP